LIAKKQETGVINGQKWTQVQSITYSIDWGEYEIYGIDDSFPQEIASGGRVSSRGSVNGLKLRNDGNLQGSQIRGLITSILSTPYISIRIQDRITKEDIIYWVKAKVQNERFSFPSKGIVQVNFNFIGKRPLQPLDRGVANLKDIDGITGVS